MSALKILGFLIPALTGVLLGVVAFQLAQSGGGGGGGSTEQDGPLYPGWNRDPKGEELETARVIDRESGHPAVAAARQAIAEDSAQAHFRGRLGDFVIAGRRPLANFPCDSQPALAGAASARASDLNLSLPGLSGVEAIACNGQVYGLNGVVELDDQSTAFVYRNYFSRAVPKAPIDAPEDRISLVTVADRPAIMVLARQDLFPECRLFMIERPSSTDTPGIIWEISGTLTCDQAQELGAELLSEVGS